jgi:hypothetical protein
MKIVKKQKKSEESDAYLFGYNLDHRAKHLRLPMEEHGDPISTLKGANSAENVAGNMFGAEDSKTAHVTQLSITQTDVIKLLFIFIYFYTLHVR